MKWLVVLCVGACAMPAWGQMSAEEAMARLKGRQQARAAATQPTTQPAKRSILEEDREREEAMAKLAERPKKDQDPYTGLTLTPWKPIMRIDEPFAFGIIRSDPNRGGSYASGSDDVYVHGYYRSDGTYVRSHYRSRPDGITSNNRSAR